MSAEGHPPSEPRPDLDPPAEADTAEADAEPGRLPIHRVAGQIVIQSAISGVLAGALPVLGVFSLVSNTPKAWQLVVAWFGFSLALGTASVVLLVVIGVAARARRALRLVILASGAASVIFVCGAAMIWLSAISSGRGPEAAVRQLGRFLASLVNDPRDLLAILLLIGCPFVTVGALRSDAVPGTPENTVWPLWLQLVAGALSGVLGVLGAWLLVRVAPPGELLGHGLGVMAGIPPAIVLGATWGAWVEGRIVRAWVERRERAP